MVNNKPKKKSQSLFILKRLSIVGCHSNLCLTDYAVSKKRITDCAVFFSDRSVYV